MSKLNNRTLNAISSKSVNFQGRLNFNFKQGQSTGLNRNCKPKMQREFIFQLMLSPN